MNLIWCIVLTLFVADVDMLEQEKIEPLQEEDDAFALTPNDYMNRRRPTADPKSHPGRRPPAAPAIYHCIEGLPPPTQITISVHISEISSVMQGKVAMSLYLRYSWEEFRFTDTHIGPEEEFLEVAATIKDKLWLPDLYIPNAASVISPVIFVPATSFRIYRNRTVFANQYLLLELSCPFNYRYFPMDDQVCDIIVKSFGHTNCEMTLQWAAFEPLTYSKSTLAQFSYHMLLGKEGHRDGAYERSHVHMQLVLKRKLMFYLMQLYIPSTLFVVVSWISFLIPTEMVQGRMLLTITTMLTMVSLFAAGSEYVPMASYIKAIDVWICTCTFLAFYAVVNCLIDVRLFSKEAKKRMAPASGGTFVLTSQARRQTVMDIFKKHVQNEEHSIQSWGTGVDVEEEPEENIGGVLRTLWREMKNPEVEKTPILYPVVFILFNLIYWSVCLSSMQSSEEGVRGIEV